MLVEDICEYIYHHLQRMRRPLASRLQQGIHRTAIDKKIKPIGLDLPVEIQDMYSWRDGTVFYENDTLDDLYFFPGFYWLSMNNAINTYKALTNNHQWNKKWFPFFASGGGDYYAIVCEGTLNTGSVIGFIRGEKQAFIEYRSLMAMLMTIKICYDEKIFYISEEGFLESDDYLHFQVAQKYNPGLEFYKIL